MKMRGEQIDAFEAAAVRDFEDRMVAHLSQFFPERCAPLGKDRVRMLIREGVTQAAHWRIEYEADVCKYLDLFFAFGPQFASDPKYPWARQLLERRLRQDSTATVDALYDAGLDSIQRATG